MKGLNKGHLMNKKRKINSVVLVEPTFGHDKKHTFGGHNEFEPLGLEYIAAVLQRKGYQVILLRQMSLTTEEITQRILSYNPDIVCFTVLTYNFQEALLIAKIIKAFDKKIKTIFGGYHPSTDSENVLKEDSVDFVIIGEGEITIEELIDAFENNCDYTPIQGIAFKKDGTIFKTNVRTRLKNLDEIPFPFREEYLLRDCKIYGLMFPPPSNQINTVTIACSRGCPFNCEFCCSNTVWGTGVTYRSPKNIIQEILEVQNRFKSNAIFFSDLTFNSNKKWVKEICLSIIDSGLKFNWYCMCTILGMDKELVQLMSKAGCRKIGFGIETLDDEVSNTIKSFKRPSINEMNEIFDLCSDNEIFTKAYLIIGLPDETYNTLMEYKEKINTMSVDEVKISFYTPFPGTKAFYKYKHKLAYTDYSFFDTLNHVVVKNDRLTEDEYKAIRKEIIQDFYLREEYLLRMQNNISKNPSLAESYSEFFEFLSLKNKLREFVTCLC